MCGWSWLDVCSAVSRSRSLWFLSSLCVDTPQASMAQMWSLRTQNLWLFPRLQPSLEILICQSKKLAICCTLYFYNWTTVLCCERCPLLSLLDLPNGVFYALNRVIGLAALLSMCEEKDMVVSDLWPLCFSCIFTGSVVPASLSSMGSSTEYHPTIPIQIKMGEFIREINRNGITKFMEREFFLVCIATTVNSYCVCSLTLC